MTAPQLLENFIRNHPDFWNFNEELKEVERLKKACEIKTNNSNSQ